MPTVACVSEKKNMNFMLFGIFLRVQQQLVLL